MPSAITSFFNARSADAAAGTPSTPLDPEGRPGARARAGGRDIVMILLVVLVVLNIVLAACVGWLMGECREE